MIRLDQNEEEDSTAGIVKRSSFDYSNSGLLLKNWTQQEPDPLSESEALKQIHGQKGLLRSMGANFTRGMSEAMYKLYLQQGVSRVRTIHCPHQGRRSSFKLRMTNTV